MVLRGQAYAKSLHYKEAEFLSSPATSIQVKPAIGLRARY